MKKEEGSDKGKLLTISKGCNMILAAKEVILVEDIIRLDRILAIHGMCEASIELSKILKPGPAVDGFLDSCLSSIARIAGGYEREEIRRMKAGGN